MSERHVMTHDDAQQRRQAALLLAEAEHAAATVRAMLAAEPDLVGTEVLDTLQARADAARAACRRWDEPKVGSGVA
jgi:hypothetical protein